MPDNRSYQKQKLPKTGRVYRDRIPLEEDFEVMRFRTASRSGPNNITIETGRTSLSSPWTIGSSWAPEDSLEFSLDPDDGWYNEALEADIVDTEDKDVVIHEKKKRPSIRTPYARSNIFLCADARLKTRPHVYWKVHARDTYLDELLRQDGRGDFATENLCPDCLSRSSANPAPAEYRCHDCFLPDLTCSACFICRHRLNPFHNVEVTSFFLPSSIYFNILIS